MSSRAVRIAVLTLVTCGVVWAETDAIAGMVHLWNNSPMYSYGYLVPLISGFLVWSQKDTLARLDPRPAVLAGSAVFVAWLAMLGLGRLSGVLLIEQVALIVAVVGVVLLAGGWSYLRATWAGIAYLLLMVPLWDGFTEPLHVRFQLLSANVGVRMLDVVGIPAYREGTFISLPNLTIEVARACSGVNYLIAVLALGLPLAYLYLRSPWRRTLLIVSAMIIAALSNSLRVALIGVLAYLDIGAPLHGPAHVLHGLFVSGIGHIVLFVGLWLLARGERAEARSAPATPAATGPIADAPASRWRLAPVALAAAFAWLGAAWVYAYQPSTVQLAASLDRLPAQLGQWTADPFTNPPPPDWWSAADHELRRRYRLDDLAVDVLVGYYEAQRQSREVVNFRSSALHRVAHATDVPMTPGATLHVNVTREQLGPQGRLTMFWYEIDGRVETGALAVKFRTLWNAVGSGRTNGAIVCLTTDSRDAATDPARVAAMTTLAREVHRALARCLPGRAEPAVVARSMLVMPSAGRAAGA